jgi:hypothetical protein
VVEGHHGAGPGRGAAGVGKDAGDGDGAAVVEQDAVRDGDGRDPFCLRCWKRQVLGA